MTRGTFATELRLTGTEVAADARAARSAIADAEVVHMRLDHKPDNARDFYDRFVELIGRPIDAAENYVDGAPTGNRWSEIRYKTTVPDDLAFRHSKNAQPMHTDASYVSAPPQVMLFYCVNAAPSGGETVFISGRALVDELAANRPDLLDRLTTIDVTYEKAGDSRTRPIIEIVDGGRVDLNYNYFCAPADQDEAALRLNQDFLDYLQHELPDALVHPVGLQPGDAVAWWDDLVLHGRNAFEATRTDDRLIWKTGLHLDPVHA
ncbi:MAG: TauD/TfdA family dioxygenase [Actinomycetota bacterium]